MPIVPFGMARSAMKPDRMLFAWLWPGGGYFAERRYARGVRAMGGVLFLYLSGLLIGGWTLWIENTMAFGSMPKHSMAPLLLPRTLLEVGSPASMDEKFRTSLGSEPPRSGNVGWLKTKKSWMPSGDKGCPT